MTSSIADRLREERDRFVGFAFANADLLLELDRGTKVQWVGGAVKSILDVEADALIEKPFTKILADQDGVLLTASLRNLGPGQRRRGLKLALRQSAAEPDLQRTVEACIYRAFDKADERFFLSVVRAQVTAAEQGPARQRDRVTGLLEAVEFTQAATDAVKLARKSGKAACLTLIEICGEAELKNLLGAERSEALLGEIGAQLKLHAIDHESAGRVGDGKFSITHLESESPAAIAEAIAKAGQSYNLDQKALNLHETTVQFHGNSLSEDDVDGILSYIVGKFTTEGTAGMEAGSAEDYLRKKTAEILTRVVSMRDLIYDQKITLHYQPIVSLVDRYQHHYEVLLRLPNGRSPFEDVRFAEEINIVHELDLAVTNGAIRRIMEANGKKHHLCLAVNMSAKSLLNDSFIAMFERVTERLGEDRKKLMVEITESAKLEDLGRAAKAVDWLRGRGHAVCLDDFGAGASSLPYLQQLHVDLVKIDGVYIRNIHDSLRERAIVEGVLTTCKCLGIRTVAEMVEKEDQHRILLDLGVDLGQGWLYGRPAAEIPPPAPARFGKRLGAKEMWG
jgi:EAL domain-containing protein (putative c-di-GMP-specific phosphodiesterase class I)/GGDEF domain-containing protein